MLQVEDEHFVFSTFGVLHVLPNAPSESKSLAEWQREAVLWKAVSSIPFFKHYLIRKMFDRCVNYSNFLNFGMSVLLLRFPLVPEIMHKEAHEVFLHQ